MDRKANPRDNIKNREAAAVSQNSDKSEKLALRLRENLRKRKDQARGRRAQSEPVESAPKNPAAAPKTQDTEQEN